jgi:hypothetical protein
MKPLPKYIVAHLQLVLVPPITCGFLTVALISLGRPDDALYYSLAMLAAGIISALLYLFLGYLASLIKVDRQSGFRDDFVGAAKVSAALAIIWAIIFW